MAAPADGANLLGSSGTAASKEQHWVTLERISGFRQAIWELCNAFTEKLDFLEESAYIKYKFHK